MAIELEPREAGLDSTVRLHRSRLAFAVAVTLAAVPVLVVDNMSAQADANTPSIEVSYGAELRTAWDTSSSVTAAPATTAMEAPAPPATEAPSTAAAESTTTDAPVVLAVAAPAPTTVAPPTTAPPTTAPPSTFGDPSDPATWDRLANCESGGNWALNSGNGYYGGLQFSLSTWQSVGGTGYPHQASRAEQITRGKLLQARAGWGQWPYCARQLGFL